MLRTFLDTSFNHTSFFTPLSSHHCSRETFDELNRSECRPPTKGAICGYWKNPFSNPGTTSMRSEAEVVFQGVTRQGWRVQAYMDLFTASRENNFRLASP
ncbi:MAG: hypothetical protein O7G86_05265 [Gammaproteobacteria bacterium]|nr:hypothetical protein [Gammaproteobacteria bacterium]